MAQSAEHLRLQENGIAWKRWGPYLSDRQWGTVREDYSANGDAWNYFPHDHARSRAYRWGEDGIAGISDDHQWLCFALALWNGQDPILKERLFGLTGPEGNHGEDVKEYYFYLDSTPTHSYMKMLYKYPQRAFPYADLVETNRRRGKNEPEYELIDTGIFNENRYFDVFVEYAKAAPDELLIRITAHNRGPDAAELHLLPTLWFRNNWSWGRLEGEVYAKPGLWAGQGCVHAEHHMLGRCTLACDGRPTFLFTENDTNTERLYGKPNPSPHVKDGIHDTVVHARTDAVNPEEVGTKAAAHYRFTVPAGDSVSVRLRLAAGGDAATAFADFDRLFEQRRAEADEFYAAIQPAGLSDDLKMIQRQALAGMLWSKQFYCYNVTRWLDGDPLQPPPAPEREKGRNHDWTHFSARDLLSMCDKWEYPYFCAWDVAFHCIPLALVDLEFAKGQLKLLSQEWFQHPNGQIPAYEWNFNDVNPPVLAWAAWEVYRYEKRQTGKHDPEFLEFMFHKLALFFTWWVNRKDADGRNIFQGGFLGLDNIGPFDRSMELPPEVVLNQSDGTSWMALFCMNMVMIALELASTNAVYLELAMKYVHHYLFILAAIESMGETQLSLWDPDDGFFYDVIQRGDERIPLKLRSMVGLIPLFAVSTIEAADRLRFPEVGERLDWFLRYRPHLLAVRERWRENGEQGRELFALCREERLVPMLRRMLDEREFLSPYGVRALSRCYADQPWSLRLPRYHFEVRYLPAESDSGMFGGNSNWRGPIWFPVNYLLIESLRQYHRYFGETLQVECPTGSGNQRNLGEVADDLARRLIRLFERDERGRRAVFGDVAYFHNDPHWRDYIPFHEYFHGDNGRGLGASHQTGWTGLVASLIQELGERVAPQNGAATAAKHGQATSAPESAAEPALAGS